MPTYAKRRHGDITEALLWAVWMIAAPFAPLVRRTYRWCVQAAADISAGLKHRRDDTPHDLPHWFTPGLTILALCALVLVVVW